MNIAQIFYRLQYRIFARHYRGHGIHSPFVFGFIRNTLNPNAHFYAFEQISEIRNEYLNNEELLVIKDRGAGSNRLKLGRNKSVKRIAFGSGINHKHGRLLFLIVNRFKPQTIIELGTSLGISSLYLALPNKSAKLYTIDACHDSLEVAKHTFSKLNCVGIETIEGDFDSTLPSLLNHIKAVDLAFIDGNHTYEATLRNFNLLVNKTHDESIVIFDDIDWSAGMHNAWREVCNDSKVTISIDLGRIGIVFFRKECKKQHFRIRI